MKLKSSTPAPNFLDTRDQFNGGRFFHRVRGHGFVCCLDPMCAQMWHHSLAWPGSWETAEWCQIMAGVGDPCSTPLFQDMGYQIMHFNL